MNYAEICSVLLLGKRLQASGWSGSAHVTTVMSAFGQPLSLSLIAICTLKVVPWLPMSTLASKHHEIISSLSLPVRLGKTSLFFFSHFLRTICFFVSVQRRVVVFFSTRSRFFLGVTWIYKLAWQMEHFLIPLDFISQIHLGKSPEKEFGNGEATLGR